MAKDAILFRKRPFFSIIFVNLTRFRPNLAKLTLIKLNLGLNKAKNGTYSQIRTTSGRHYTPLNSKIKIPPLNQNTPLKILVIPDVCSIPFQRAISFNRTNLKTENISPPSGHTFECFSVPVF